VVGLLDSVEYQMVRSGKCFADSVDILVHDFTIPTLSSLEIPPPAPRFRKSRFRCSATTVLGNDDAQVPLLASCAVQRIQLFVARPPRITVEEPR
jgi:hypothetical protein